MDTEYLNSLISSPYLDENFDSLLKRKRRIIEGKLLTERTPVSINHIDPSGIVYLNTDDGGTTYVTKAGIEHLPQNIKNDLSIQKYWEKFPDAKGKNMDVSWDAVGNILLKKISEDGSSHTYSVPKNAYKHQEEGVKDLLKKKGYLQKFPDAEPPIKNTPLSEPTASVVPSADDTVINKNSGTTKEAPTNLSSNTKTDFVNVLILAMQTIISKVKSDTVSQSEKYFGDRFDQITGKWEEPVFPKKKINEAEDDEENTLEPDGDEIGNATEETGQFLHDFGTNYRRYRNFNISMGKFNYTLKNGKLKNYEVVWGNRRNRNDIFIKSGGSNTVIMRFWDQEVNPRVNPPSNFNTFNFVERAIPNAEETIFIGADPAAVKRVTEVNANNTFQKALYATVHRKSMEVKKDTNANIQLQWTDDHKNVTDGDVIFTPEMLMSELNSANNDHVLNFIKQLETIGYFKRFPDDKLIELKERKKASIKMESEGMKSVTAETYTMEAVKRLIHSKDEITSDNIYRNAKDYEDMPIAAFDALQGLKYMGLTEDQAVERVLNVVKKYGHKLSTEKYSELSLANPEKLAKIDAKLASGGSLDDDSKEPQKSDDGESETNPVTEPVSKSPSTTSVSSPASAPVSTTSVSEPVSKSPSAPVSNGDEPKPEHPIEKPSVSDVNVGDDGVISFKKDGVEKKVKFGTALSNAVLKVINSNPDLKKKYTDLNAGLEKKKQDRLKITKKKELEEMFGKNFINPYQHSNFLL